MNKQEFNQFCGTFKAAHHVVQWGNSDVWKVGKKVFAIGFTLKNGDLTYTFKASDRNYAFLKEYSGYRPAPYFANRGMKWIQPIETDGSLDEDLMYYINESYRIVSSSLSKKEQLRLGLV